MEIKEWAYDNVNPDGTFQFGDGAVVVDGELSFSSMGGGCNFDNCKCSEGHWICIPEPYKDGVVRGVTLYFPNEAKLIQFIDVFIMKSKRTPEPKE